MRNYTQLPYLTSIMVYSLAILIASITFFTNLYDDAYIHARIVDNFFNFGSFAFNYGDNFKASSSTGYILLIAFINLFTGDSILSIRIIAFVGLLAYFYAASLLFRSTNSYIAKACLIATAPFVVTTSFGGMETTLSIVFFLISAHFLFNKKYLLAVVLSATCIVFRVEFALYFLLLFTYLIVSGHFKLQYIVGCLPVILLIIIDLLLYGSFLPHAASVKSIAYNHPYLNSLLSSVSFSSNRIWLILLLPLYILLGIFLIKQSLNLKTIKAHTIFLLFGAGVLFAWFIGKSNIFPWYLPIATTSFLLAIFFRFTVSNERINKYEQYLAVFCSLIIFINGALKLLNTYSPFKPTSNARVLSYLDIGNELYKYCPECTLMTSEIGGLGYSYKGKVYDGFGLGDKEAVKFHPMSVPEQRQSYGVGAIPNGYIKFKKPDYIVSMPVFTFEFRNSETINTYINYFCPFSNNLYLWSNSGIYIHSKRKINENILKKLNCFEDENLVNTSN